jgi:glycine betaine monooxygenase B
VTNDTLAEFSLTFTVSGRTVACAPDRFVLDAALAAGLKLPFTCRRGICGTCKSRLLSGTYDMKHLGGIRPREIESGLFLPCCSKPLSDLVIEK